MYSIHVFLKRNELILQNRNNPLTHRKWTIEEMDLVEERVNNDFHKRRIAERICMNNTCRKSHILLKLIIKSELSKLKKKRIYTQRIHNKLTTRIVHQSEKIKDTCQNQSSSNNRNLMKDLEIQKIKKKHGSYIAQIHLRSSHYIQDYFRVLLRILQMSLILSQESCNFLHDLGTNAKSMRKTLSFVEGKLNAVEVIDRNNYYKEWMEFQHKHFVSCLTNSDCDQELILSNEVMRINEEIKLVYSIRKVFEEYWVASYALCSYVAEGIAPNVEVIVNEGEPEVNLIQLHRIKFLNAKQKTIRESILPKIQKQLDKLYQIAERRTDFPAMKVLDLKIDFEPDLEFDTMLEHLNSVSNDKKDSVLLFLHEEWMDLFLSQPWVAKERAEESRLHQARNMERRMLQNKEKELEKRKFRLKYDHQQAVFTKDLMEELKREEAKADKSKFKRKELHNAYSTLENILNEFEKNSKHRSDSIRKEEHDAQTRLRHLKNEENSSRTRRGILQKAIYEFEVKELNHEKEYIKKLDVEESILREEALEIQNLIQIGITPKSTKDMRKGQNPNIGQLSSFMNNIKSGKNVSLNTMSADLLKRYELYNARKQTLVSERQKCDERHKKRLDLLKKTKIETEIQIYKENLRALQQEIQLRKERLSSITTTQENSEKGTFFEENIMWLSKGELKKIRSLINNNDRIQRDYSGIFDIADLTRKTGTSFVRQLRNIRNKENENIEEKQMMTIVRRRMSMQERKVKGISQIMFTVGKRETGDFAVENHELQIKGLPYFHRLKKEIGIQEQIVIWMKSTTLQKEFITDVKLGNTIFGHPEYKNLTSEGYELVEHNCMKGEHMKDPSLHLWYKKDLFSINFICDLNVSYSIKEEEDLQKEEFERVNISLSNFGLGNNFLWTRKEDRSAKITLTDSTHMTAQLEEYTNMQTKNPDDPILQDMVEKMRRRLHAVQLKEENDLLDLKDDVKYIVDFLSLRKDDLKKFEKVYLKIDKDNDGFISLDEFRLFIDKNAESLKTFSNHIFTVSIGNPPEDDKLEFGSTIKSVSMFCLLTRDEILKFIFSIFDGKGFGSITNEAFMQILSMMHPKHHGRAIRALHEFDLPKTGKMSFAEFDSLQSRFPNLLYPALRYQVRSAF